MELFPENMANKTSELSIEIIAGKLMYFQDELQMLHWQTLSHSEHLALGSLYGFIYDFKDGLLEKLMGYAKRRVKVFKIPQLSETSSEVVVSELELFAKSLVSWAKVNNYDDIEGMAQCLSGEAAKTKYLLTLN